jgi:hypothetical protein
MRRYEFHRDPGVFRQGTGGRYCEASEVLGKELDLLGTYNGGHVNTVPVSLESAVAAGIIAPCIIVFPDGYNDSFWADAVNENKPAETNTLREIIPYVEANFRASSAAGAAADEAFFISFPGGSVDLTTAAGNALNVALTATGGGPYS